MPKGKQSDARSRTTQNRLKMYDTRAKRDKKGKVVWEAFKSKDESHQARIQPDRRWFGSTRTVDQDELSRFRDEMAKQKSSPATYVLKPGKVPFSLLNDVKQDNKPTILGVQGFGDTFGKKATRKRPNLSFTDIEEMKARTAEQEDKYEPSKDRNMPEERDWRPLTRDPVFSKGQSHRIWGELHKVLDSSDVVIEVLDARDPMGTRAWHVEKLLKKNAPHKHVLLLLNKADLVPSWALKRWLAILSKEYPVIAFHASITKPFGKGSLIQVLRQFQHLHSDKQQISVGFIGYPNVGKSSVINTLRRKKVCPAAPVPGYTKVWQYITLFKKIFLVDCPGVVYASDDTDSDIVLKGVVRVESLEDAVEHIPQVLQRCRKQHIINTYGIFKWDDHEDFLKQLARKMGRLLPGNEPDLNSTAKIVLHDWLKGKIPFFVPPPFEDGTTVPRGQLEREAKAAEMEVEQAEEEGKIVSKLNPPPQLLKNLNVRAEYLDHKGPEDDVDKLPVTKDEDIIESDSEDDDSDEDDDPNAVDWDAVYGEADGSEDDEDLVPVDAINPIPIKKKANTQVQENDDDEDEGRDDDVETIAKHKRNSIKAQKVDEESEQEDEEDVNEEDDDEEEEVAEVALPAEGLTKIQMTRHALRKKTPTKKRKRNLDPSDADVKVIEGGFGHFKRSGTRKPKDKRDDKSQKKSQFEVVPEGYRPSKKRKMK